MRIVHHPRNSPEYMICSCSHQMVRHFTNPTSRAAAAIQLTALSDMIKELAPRFDESQAAELLAKLQAAGFTLYSLGSLERQALLSALKAAGCEKLGDRQALATAVIKARRAGRIADIEVETAEPS